MHRSTIAAALFVLTSAAGLAAGAASYDNPKTGSAPCVVLNRFQVTAPGSAATPPGSYRADAEIENICGRTVQVSFCFLYAEPVDNVGGFCREAPLRPGERQAIALPGSPVRVTGPEYYWRYLASP